MTLIKINKTFKILKKEAKIKINLDSIFKSSNLKKRKINKKD